MRPVDFNTHTAAVCWSLSHLVFLSFECFLCSSPPTQNPTVTPHSTFVSYTSTSNYVFILSYFSATVASERLPHVACETRYKLFVYAVFCVRFTEKHRGWTDSITLIPVSYYKNWQTKYVEYDKNYKGIL